MLGHAPPPLTANGLDMRDGHPAEMKAAESSQARFSRLGAPKWAHQKNKRKDQKRKTTPKMVIRSIYPDELVRMIQRATGR